MSRTAAIWTIAHVLRSFFSTRAKAIDRMPGFCGMQVLRPRGRVGGKSEVAPKGVEGGREPFNAYLVISFWRSGADFERWTGSPEFLEGHKRGFDDIRKAKEAGLEPPMTSVFHTYDVIAR